MDYTQALRERAAQTVAPLRKEATAQRTELAGLRRRLATLEGDNTQLERDIARLKSSAGQRTADRDSFERILTALKKKQTALAVGQDMAAVLRQDVLPPAEAALKRAEAVVNGGLLALALDMAKAVEAKMVEYISLAVCERDDFMDALTKVSDDILGTTATPFLLAKLSINPVAYRPGKQPTWIRAAGLSEDVIEATFAPAAAKAAVAAQRQLEVAETIQDAPAAEVAQATPETPAQAAGLPDEADPEAGVCKVYPFPDPRPARRPTLLTGETGPTPAPQEVSDPQTAPDTCAAEDAAQSATTSDSENPEIAPGDVPDASESQISDTAPETGENQ